MLKNYDELKRVCAFNPRLFSTSARIASELGMPHYCDICLAGGDEGPGRHHIRQGAGSCLRAPAELECATAVGSRGPMGSIPFLVSCPSGAYALPILFH